MYILENPVPEHEMDDESEAALSQSPPEPMVIAEKAGEIRTLTPSMAALELGLADSGVVIFNNARHGGLNVVFKRADGNIGWIDPDA